MVFFWCSNVQALHNEAVIYLNLESRKKCSHRSFQQILSFNFEKRIQAESVFLEKAP